MLQRGVPQFNVDALIEVGRGLPRRRRRECHPTVRDLTARDPITFEQFVTDHRSAFA
jgi:hypothetical protein